MVIPPSVESANHYHDAIGVDNLPASRLSSKVGRYFGGLYGDLPYGGGLSPTGMATNQRVSFAGLGYYLLKLGLGD